MPGIKYPRIPGHEVIGAVDAIGDGVQGFSVGARAGVGWFGGACGYCRQCRRDSAAEDPAKALTAIGGAKAILATVTNGEAVQAIAGGLGPNGVLMVIGAVGPLTGQFARSSCQTRIGQRLVFGDRQGFGRYVAV